jgi:Ca2+-binding RTX toxin-like protein
MGAGDDSVTLGAGIPPVSVGGGAGNDTIVGGTGDDTLVGGQGDDSLTATSGNNVVSGGAGDDTLMGGTGGDSLLGGKGTDYLISGVGQNTAIGGGGDDTIATTGGTDQLLSGGGGSNFFINGEGSGATIQGGAGLNVAQQNSNDTLENILEVFDPPAPSSPPPTPQEAPAIAIVPAPQDESVTAAVTNGVLLVRGTAGDDNISITTNNSGDLLVNADGAPPVPFPASEVSSIVVVGLAGNDTISVASDITLQSRLRGNGGNDSITGGGGNNVLVGGLGSDTLVGGGGENFLVPTQRLVFTGDTGDNELLIGGPAGSQNIADLSHRTDNLYLSNDGVAHDGITIMPNVLNIFAGTGLDTVVATQPGEFLSAGAGRDSLVSGGNNAILVAGPVGAGEDTVSAVGIANSLFLQNGHEDEYEGFIPQEDFLQLDSSDVSI